MKRYLKALRQMGQRPNFWCSSEYARRAGWRSPAGEIVLDVFDADGVQMLPTLVKLERKGNPGPYQINRATRCWAGFAGDSGRLLDFEFIYNPADFMDISGPRWKKVRKCIRQAKADLPCADLSYGNVYDSDSALNEFVYRWAIQNSTGTFYEPDVMESYMMEGESRLLLIDPHSPSRAAYALLIWDQNWQYINFRYCCVESGVRGLSDLARVKFMRWIHLYYPGRLVNDGGALDSKELFTYKTKLNPLEINNIRTTLEEK